MTSPSKISYYTDDPIFVEQKYLDQLTKKQVGLVYQYIKAYACREQVSHIITALAGDLHSSLMANMYNSNKMMSPLDAATDAIKDHRHTPGNTTTMLNWSMPSKPLLVDVDGLAALATAYKNCDDALQDVEQQFDDCWGDKLAKIKNQWENSWEERCI